ncbi:MAG TPA: allophanate hydrolase subunit 1 [Stackebrandtia sp.]|jgi:KipI family sensor histidine kinase inhibitor|uniref:5-oxoprolinase subunit B family protein n=1 Tax=Stackebrandtia sp. TaxID=2023065 RepID=UPI002D301996|nr:allophanate hydrolase subunit 1 [Stackebrandtia sp.]HZE40258.1 allophanate hydrolase subunit 1 [Stackebrandtia sp.]
MRAKRYGQHAVLIEVDDLDEVVALHAALLRDPPPGVTAAVPAARTVLVRYDRRATTMDKLVSAVAELPSGAPDPKSQAPVDIPVCYDGADLDEVARLCGLDPGDVVARHAAGEYRAAFAGFAPGFCYLTGLDPALRVPRRATPRTAVPSGAVAIADEYTAVYPRSSPGGWHILGRTAMSMWDTHARPPARLAPGTRVRFTEVTA